MWFVLQFRAVFGVISISEAVREREPEAYEMVSHKTPPLVVLGKLEAKAWKSDTSLPFMVNGPLAPSLACWSNGKTDSCASRCIWPSEHESELKMQRSSELLMFQW